MGGLSNLFAGFRAATGSRAGSEDPETGTLYTTPWAWRTAEEPGDPHAGGVYVGLNNEVWLYRVLPMTPLQWEDRSERAQVGGQLNRLLQELGATSTVPVGAIARFSNNREIHLLMLSWEAPAKPPEGTPPGLKPYLEELLDFLEPRRALFVGVRLRASIAPPTSKSGFLDQLGKVATKVIAEDVPDLDAYTKDRVSISSMLAKYGGKVPQPDEYRQLEGWYNLGGPPQALMVENPTSIEVESHSELELSAVMNFERKVMPSLDTEWALDTIASSSDAPHVVSIRAELEPAKVAQSRARRSARKLASSMEEEAATGDLENVEYSDTYALSQELDRYFATSGEALLSRCSIVLARHVRPNLETYRDFLATNFGIQTVPLQMRQMHLLEETLPCATKRAVAFPQDLSLSTVAYAGLQSFSALGDRQGMYIGLSDPDYTAVYVDPLGAPAANLPPVMGVFGDPGSGKAQPLDARILTPEGWKTMGEMQVGSRVIGRDGQAHPVVGVFPQGEKEIFELTFSDGSSTRACGEHLWKVRRSQDAARGRGWRVHSTAEIQGMGLRDRDGKLRFQIPVAAPIECERAELPLDPYLLGVLLGDGNITAYAGFSSADEEIVAGVAALLPPQLRVRHYGRSDYRIVSAGRGYPNAVTRSLRTLGLFGKRAEEKSIPRSYLAGSLEQRWALLQGLLDTDGEVANTAAALTTCSPQLAADVTELVNSLGGVVYRRERYPTYTHNGERRVGRLSYTLTLALPGGHVPFRLARKSQLWRPRTKYMPGRRIVDIQSMGTAPAQCIMVGSEDHTYLTDDHIVTHNTFLCQNMALQAALGGLQTILVNPKGGDTLESLVDYAREQGVPAERIGMRALEARPGAFDPFRFAEPTLAAEIAAIHIIEGIPSLSESARDSDRIKLESGLRYGAIDGVKCVGDALNYVDQPELVALIRQLTEANPLFGLGIGLEPAPPLSSISRLTLIEFDRELGLPEGKDFGSYTVSERIAVAAVRLVTRASLELLINAGSGVLILDEAWTFLSQPQSKAALQRISREGRSLNILPIFATQRIADVIDKDMEGYISRVFVMKLTERREAEAALRLCKLEATPGRLSWLASAGPRRMEDGTTQWSRGLHRDLKNRHSAVHFGPTPAEAAEAFSTNPLDRARRREAAAGRIDEAALQRDQERTQVMQAAQRAAALNPAPSGGAPVPPPAPTPPAPNGTQPGQMFPPR